MANKMLIDATHPEETRVVVLRGNRVEEFDFESAHRKQLRGNIYLAKVTRVEPSLQAAFVDYGGNRHGFLAFSEIHPDYYQIPVADRQALIDEEKRAARAADDEADRRSRRRRHHPGQPAARRNDVRRGETAEPGEPAGAQTADHSDQATLAPADQEHAEQPFGATGTDESFHSDNELSSDAHEEHEDAEDAEQPWDNQSGEADTAEPHEAEAADAGSTGADHDHDTGHDADHHLEHGAAGDTGAGSSEPGDHPHEAHAETADRHDGGDTDGHDNGQSNGQENGHENGQENGQENSRRNGQPNGDDEDVVESVGGSDALEEVPDRAPRYRRQYKIQEVIKRRQVMLVQVVKEERGTKGAALTTYLSLAGRYSVLMPNTARGGGISRKITSGEDRARLKEVAQELEVPEGMGVILRTAGANRTKLEIKRDFEYLLRLWETVRDLTLKSTAPKLVYEEGSLVKRSIRDLYSKDIDEVMVAGSDAYSEAKDFMRMLMPSHAKNVKLYAETQPLLSRYGVENQLDAMFSPVVQLRSGGYIVLNQAEALVAIDVNSGRATREHHIEDTALKTNLEAADEIARQLRLRDLAGLIVIDFIDMDEKRNNRSVERRMKECLKQDRARIQVGRISHFGLLEMSRQRIRTSVLESSTEKCPYCGGSGHVRSVSSLALQVLRALEEQLIKGATHNLIARTRPDVALYVLNQKRAHLRGLEERFAITITVSADETVMAPQAFVIDRGEMVHSVEAAKAIAEQAQAVVAAAPLEDEDDLDEIAAAENEEVVAEAADVMTAPEPEPQEDDAPRRRRRRRRGGGRDNGDRTPRAQPHEGANGTVGEAFQPGDDEPLSEDTVVEGEPAHAEPAGERPESQHDGERRRRRRGRRGGRRNRHDRDGGNGQEHGQENGQENSQEASQETGRETGQETNQDGGHEIGHHTDEHDLEHVPQHGFAASEDSAEITAPPPAPEPDLRDAVADLDAAPPAAAPIARRSSPPPAAEPEPPRRRSTVREPAPVGMSEAAPPPAAPTPVPERAITEASESQDADRPRKTGWWAKRFAGG